MAVARKRVVDNDGIDRISDLPIEVIDEILMHLPIQDAVKTSLLSSNWRYKWTSMSSLIFEPSSSSIPVLGEQQRNKLVNFVNQVLLLHNGTVSVFILDNVLDSGSSDVDRWFVVLSRKMLKDLFLRFIESDNLYRIPGSLFSCQFLNILGLENCELRLPFQLEQLKFLTFLELNSVTFNTETSDTLVVKNPLLRNLEVSYRGVLIHLNVDAPKLKTVSIVGLYISIKFRNTSKVESATIVVSSPMQSQEGVLEGLDALQSLNLCYIPWQILPAGASPKRLEVTYYRLKSINMHVDFKCSKWVKGLLCLLRSSPILENLEMNAKIAFVRLENELYVHLDDENAWEAPEPTIFHHLKGVRFNEFKGLELELKLTKFILRKAVVLKTFNIIWDGSVVMEDKLTIVMKMMQFQRASSKVKFSFN